MKRNAGIVLQHGLAVGQDEAANGGELVVVRHIRGSLEQRDGPFQPRGVLDELRVGLEVFVVQVDGQVVHLVHRLVFVGAIRDLQSLIAVWRARLVAEIALDQLAVIVQARIAEAQDGIVPAHQHFQNRQQQAIGDLPAELTVHFAGNKKAAAEYGAHAIPRGGQVARQVLLPAELFQAGQGPGGFQRHQDVGGVVGKAGRGIECVGTAEWVIDNRLAERRVGQLGFPKSLEAGDERALEMVPGSIQPATVVLPSLGLFQFRERAAGMTGHSGQETGRIVRIPVLRHRYWHGGRGLFFFGGSCRRRGGVSAARRNRGKGEQEGNQEGTSISYDHAQKLFRFCRILRPCRRVLRHSTDCVNSIALHGVSRHLHR
ncbi:MAG: hypothetical protein ABSH37_23190 [Bryobacteraceae bacterium]